MGLKLMFFEGDNVKYVLEHWFNSRLAAIEESIADEIISQLVKNMEQFPKTKPGYSSVISGVVKRDTPFFFKIEFTNSEEEALVFLDIEQIGLEEYLDSIDRNKYLKTETT